MTIEMTITIIVNLVTLLVAVGTIVASYTRLSSTVETLRRDVDELRKGRQEDHDRIIEMAARRFLYRQAPEKYTKKKSPRQLTELGEKVFAECKGEEFLASNKAALFDGIRAMNPLRPYDVEQAAVDTCMDQAFTPMFNPIRDYVYNAPEMEADGEPQEVELRDICFILGIRLRDMYLAEHPEIAAE